MSNRLDSQSRLALASAAHLSRSTGYGLITSQHLLYGLAAIPGHVSEILKGFGVTGKTMASAVENSYGSWTAPDDFDAKFSLIADEIVTAADQIATRSGSPETSPLHLLHAIVEGPSSPVSKVIEKAAGGLWRVRESIVEKFASDDFSAELRIIVSAGERENASDFERGAADVARRTLRHLGEVL